MKAWIWWALATSAIDISDGLVADLGHITESSGVGASLNLDQLPVSSDLLDLVGRDCAIGFASTGGDDYELCFTVPPSVRDTLLCHVSKWSTRGHTYGLIEKGKL